MTPPRQRKPPTRYTGRAAAYHAATAEEHFRAIFFVILDNSMEQMRQRFDKSAQGICRYLCLEQALLLGKAEYELVSCYTQSLKRMPGCATENVSQPVYLSNCETGTSLFTGCVRKFVHCSVKLNNLLDCCWSVQHPLVLQSAALGHLEDSKHGFEIT